MDLFKGIGISENVAIGIAHVYQSTPRKIDKTLADSAEEEIAKLEKALTASRGQIDELLSNTDGETNTIVSVQLSYLNDPDFIGEIRKLIEERGYSAGRSVNAVTDELYKTFAAMEDEMIRERAADIRDVGERIFGNITGSPTTDLSQLPQKNVLVAEELTPTQMTQLDKRHVVGIVLEKGGTTSHVAIIARAMGIAAVLGCTTATNSITNGQTIIVDGENSNVTVDPDATTVKHYESVIEKKNAVKNSTMGKKDAF